MNFSFTTSYGGGETVVNGENPESGAPGFFLSFVTCDAGLANCAFDTVIDGYTSSTGISAVLISFNDGSEHGSPLNGESPPYLYDDLVIMLQLGRKSVPEPATLLLLLGAAGLAASRRKA